MFSAGLVPYRFSLDLEIMIAHPGGPLWARKDAGSWSIVKGRIEETGWPVPPGDWLDLGEITQRSGKRVVAWAVDAPDLDPDTLDPGHFEMRWRGKLRSFPEIDRVRWVNRSEAQLLMMPAQLPFFDRLAEQIEP